MRNKKVKGAGQWWNMEVQCVMGIRKRKRRSDPQRWDWNVEEIRERSRRLDMDKISIIYFVNEYLSLFTGLHRHRSSG